MAESSSKDELVVEQLIARAHSFELVYHQIGNLRQTAGVMKN
jgi:hypothetical protein